MDAFKIFLSFFSFWEFNYSVFCGKDGKEPALQCRRPRFDPWFGKISGEGNGHPFQYSCLENPMDRGACGLQSTGSQSQTRLSTHTHIHTHRRMLKCDGTCHTLQLIWKMSSTSLSCGIDKNVLRLVLSRNANSHHYSRASLMAGSVVGNPPANAGNTGSIPDPGRPCLP